METVVIALRLWSNLPSGCIVIPDDVRVDIVSIKWFIILCTESTLLLQQLIAKHKLVTSATLLRCTHKLLMDQLKWSRHIGQCQTCYGNTNNNSCYSLGLKRMWLFSFKQNYQTLSITINCICFNSKSFNIQWRCTALMLDAWAASSTCILRLGAACFVWRKYSSIQNGIRMLKN